MGLKFVWESRILRVERRGPLNAFVSRKTARLDDISQVKLIVGWNELAKLTKMETSSIRMFHKENMSSLNLSQTRGFSGLAASSRFSMSAIKNNGESDRHFSSHSDAVSLCEAFFIKLKRAFFKYEPD